MIVLVANWSLWLAGQVVLVAFLVLFSTVFTRALNRSKQDKTLADLSRDSNIFVGMMAGLILFDFLALAAIGVVVGGLSGWLMVGAAVIVCAWVAWNLPANNRTIIVDAETDISGDPYKVSAFFADVGDWGKWSPEVISSVEAGMSVQGPRFHQVGTIPGTNSQIAGDVVLKVNEPGKEVTVGVEGAGRTAGQFLLSPSGTGTHVLYREVLEVPFILALAGGMLLTRDKDRTRRHTEELARAKAVFESAHAATS